MWKNAFTALAYHTHGLRLRYRKKCRIREGAASTKLWIMWVLLVIPERDIAKLEPDKKRAIHMGTSFKSIPYDKCLFTEGKPYIWHWVGTKDTG